MIQTLIQLDDPSNSELGIWMDKQINEVLNATFEANGNGSFNITLSGILNGCELDESAYEVFQINQFYNITGDLRDWQSMFDFDESVDNIKVSY